MLRKADIAFDLHPYAYDPGAERVGLQAAEALGLDPGIVLKTLMVEVDGRPACCIIPSDRELSMKRVAAAFGGRQAAMMPVPRAERLSGYHVGGIGPFGQRRPVPTALEESVAAAPRVYINAGQRGLLLSIAPGDALAATDGISRPLIA